MLEFALITGLISGFAGFLGSGFNDDREAAKKKREMDYIDEMYNLNRQRAETEFQEAQRQANREASQAELQADLTDSKLNVTERAISNDVNTAIDNMYLSQTQDAMSWNSAQMQMGSQQGAAYAQLAGSGVRTGSSLSDAVMMESANNSAALQFSQDAKRRSDSNNLSSVLNGLAGQRYDIMSNRIGADLTRENALDLRNSFQAGGYNYNLYQNQLETLKTQRDYNWNAAKKEKEQHEGFNKFINAITAGIGLGAKGTKTGYSLADSTYKAMEYRKTLG